MQARLENMLRNLRQSKQKKDQAGFTLIELMIVVAIIGILAAIAIPQYQAYTGRAQASEALSLFGGVKTSMGEYYNDKGCWPGATACAVATGSTATKDAVGYAPTEIKGSYVGSVAVAADGTGCVTVTFGVGVHAAKVMKFSPSVVTSGQQGAVDWACYSPTGTTNIVDSNLPSNCRGGAPSTGYATCT
ncbi:pilin [Arenicellales bacterium IMCC56312]